MKINCDLGEHTDSKWIKRQNRMIMPAIDLANIACGGHAGNDETMTMCVQQSMDYGLQIGAHPSYADQKNFGRVSLSIPNKKLLNDLKVQIQNLLNCCEIVSEQRDHLVTMKHLKPHGALYHDCQNQLDVCQILCELTQLFNLSIITNLTLHPNEKIRECFEQYQVDVWQEVFADRKYLPNGMLTPRSQNNSVLENIEDITQQFTHLTQENRVRTDDGWLNIQADVICFHSDNPESCLFLKSLQKLSE